jgi:type II secretory pathway component GspD/PulD (secretin)
MPTCDDRLRSHKLTPYATLLACLLFLTLHSSGALAARAIQEPPLVSLSASSQDIRAVLADLADLAGVDIIVDDTLTAKVTLRLTDVPFLQALDTAAKAAGATVTEEGGLYLVTNSRNYYSAPSAPAEQSAVQIFDLSGMDYSIGLELVRAVSDGLGVEQLPDIRAVVVRGPYSKVNAVRTALDAYLRSVPTQSESRSLEIIRLSYADASEVSMSLQGQFTSVRLLPVRGSNSIAVNGVPREMEAVMAAIRELDRRPALLSFEVEIVEVNSEDMTSLGLDWQNAQGHPSFTITLKETEPSLGSISQPTDDLLDWRPWIRSSVQIAAQIRVLQGQGKAKVLARPSLTTLENKTARMVTGDRYTIAIIRKTSEAEEYG